MKSFLPLGFVPALLIAGSLSGCGPEPDPQKPSRTRDPVLVTEYRPQFDSNISKKNQETIQKDLKWLKGIRLEDTTTVFQDVFGSPSIQGVLEYLRLRTGYFTSFRIRGRNRLRPFNREIYGEARQIAQNHGLQFWYYAMMYRPRKVKFHFNAEWMEIKNPRIGIIGLSRHFFKRHRISRLSTLVHEARHSDCTGGIWASDIRRFRRKRPPVNKVCGHLHVSCPEGHAYEGLKACDDHEWGAYEVQAAFTRALAKNCPDCSEYEKQVAATITIERMTRILRKSVGKPDMSSTIQVKR